jgi:hypothetical protein
MNLIRRLTRRYRIAFVLTETHCNVTFEVCRRRLSDLSRILQLPKKRAKEVRRTFAAIFKKNEIN